jgi:putative nucleotidyltransferase with HDIG domain
MSGTLAFAKKGLTSRLKQSIKDALGQDNPAQAKAALDAVALQEEQLEIKHLGPLAKLTPFGPVAMTLLRTFDRKDVAVQQIARLVSSDAALTSELLGLANSPLFAVQMPITDLAHAIAVLGLERTQAMATTMAMRAMLKDAPKTPIMRRVWRHSIATATIAEALAPVYGVTPVLAQTAAIMHDLGRVALLTAHPNEYADLAVRSHESVDAILDAERSQFGMDHCQAGRLVAEAWRFPPVLQQVAGEHLASPSASDLLSIVQTSCRLAHDYGLAAIVHEHHRKPADTVDAHVPAALRERVNGLLQNIDRQIYERIESLDF